MKHVSVVVVLAVILSLSLSLSVSLSLFSLSVCVCVRSMVRPTFDTWTKGKQLVVTTTKKCANLSKTASEYENEINATGCEDILFLPL